MKSVFIPKGESVHYESLTTDKLIIQGRLDVTGDVRAKKICGNGVLHAGSVWADEVCLDEVETASLVCKRLLAKRIAAPDVVASESAAVSCYLASACVRTGTLTAAVSEVDTVCAEKVIHLPAKNRGMLRTLLASSLRSFWLSLTTFVAEWAAMDAEYEEVREQDVASTEDAEIQAEIAGTVQDILARQTPKPESTDEDDFELRRMVNTFKLLRDRGYTLRIIPGTPEENAPVFDETSETFYHPAA